jgi:uncharacterized protein YecE (DUF72 family)
MATGRVFAGTSGYSYKEWKDAFYPADLPESKFLDFYAGKFSTVEINNTFYRFPAEKLLQGWRDDTPEGFTFAVKANQKITHFGRLQNVDQLTRDFIERTRVLGAKLGPILFQLPPNLRCDEERLAKFLEVLPRGRYAFEFRHASWFEEKVLQRLRDVGVALCISEGEELDTPKVATGPFLYLRLRKEDYGDAELAAWRAWIAGQLDEGRDAFVYLKHDEKGISPERALRLLQGLPG